MTEAELDTLRRHEAAVRRKGEDIHLYRGAHADAYALYREADAILRCIDLLSGKYVSVPGMDIEVDEEYVACLRANDREGARAVQQRRNEEIRRKIGSVTQP